MAQYSDELINKFSLNFPSNNLLSVDLINAVPTTASRYGVDTKSQHFCFINFVPGEGSEENKTYNFKNKIVIKYSLLELEGLSKVLENNATSLGQAFSPYKKFAKSEGGNKNISVWQTGNEIPGPNNTKINKRTLFIQIQSASNKICISLTPDQAYALSSALHLIYLKGFDLEFERISKAPRVQQSSTQSYNQPQPQGGFVAPEPEYHSTNNFNNNFNDPMPF